MNVTKKLDTAPIAKQRCALNLAEHTQAKIWKHIKINTIKKVYVLSVKQQSRGKTETVEEKSFLKKTIFSIFNLYQMVELFYVQCSAVKHFKLTSSQK